jgi:hypothetical protein
VGLFLFLDKEKKSVSLQLILSGRPTDPEDFLDKFNDVIEIFLLLIDYHT